MKATLICPGERPAVSLLAAHAPLVLCPLLGQGVLEQWLEELAGQGVREVTVLASDRPAEVRAFTGGGERWGLRVEVVPQMREPDPEEAAHRHGGPVTVLDHLPDGTPDVFASYAAWHAALLHRVPRVAGPARIGLRTLGPDIWTGWRARIDPSARLQAPCWVGAHACIGAGAVIGPGTVIEDRAVVEVGSRLEGVVVGPDTYLGPHTRLAGTLVLGPARVDLRTAACGRIEDPLRACSLENVDPAADGSPWLARTIAAALMLLTIPAALAALAAAGLRGEPPVRRRVGVRPRLPGSSGKLRSFTYHEFTAGLGWLRRWPQFWSIVRGDLRWFGNRPLRPAQAHALNSEFERLWIALPPGLLSLADAHGCAEGLEPEACAHAGFYTAHRSTALHLHILTRCLARAATTWPFQPRPRSNDAGASLPQWEAKP